MIIRIAFLFCIASGAGAPAFTQEKCRSISDDAARLACYDLENEASKPTIDTGNSLGKWQKHSDTSQLTDDKNVFLQLESDDPVAGRFGGAEPATLIIRCRENTTSAFFVFNDLFMADIQGYGTIDYRLDDAPMKKLRANASTDNSALGLWSGGSAIPFIKSMLGKNRLVVRATPFNESAITVSFSISGLDEAVKELRETCHW